MSHDFTQFHKYVIHRCNEHCVLCSIAGTAKFFHSLCVLNMEGDKGSSTPSFKDLLGGYAYGTRELSRSTTATSSKCTTRKRPQGSDTHSTQKRGREQSDETQSVSSKYFGAAPTATSTSTSAEASKDLSSPEIYRRDLTPLERTVVKWKQRYPGVALFVQIGHRIRLFGPEAVIVAKLRGYKDFKLNNFRLCSFPVTFAHRAMSAAVNAGLRVGLVSQKESAPLKHSGHESKSDSTSTTETFGESQLFDRQIDHIFTHATYSSYYRNVPEDSVTLSLYEGHIEPGVGHQLNQLLYPQTVSFGAIVLNSETGDLRYRYWTETGNSREELRVFLENLNPSEVLISDCTLGEREYCLSVPTLLSLKRFAATQRVSLKLPPVLAGYGLYEDISTLEDVRRIALKEALENALGVLPPNDRDNGWNALTKLSELSYYGLWPSLDMDGKSSAPAPVYSGDDVALTDSLNIPEGRMLRIEWIPEHYFSVTESMKVTLCMQSLQPNIDGEVEIKRSLCGLITYFLRCRCDSNFLHDTLSPWAPVGRQMKLSGRTMMDLELIHTSTSRVGKGSLLSILSGRICSRSGHRLLKEWIENPLTDKESIDERLDAVEAFVGHTPWEELVEVLRQIPNYDFQRNFQLLRIGKLSPARCCLFLLTLATLPEIARRIASHSDLTLLVRLAGRVSVDCLTVDAAQALNDLRIYEQFMESSATGGSITELVLFLKKWERGKSPYEAFQSTAGSPIDAFKSEAEEKKFAQLRKQKQEIDGIQRRLDEELDALRKSLDRPDLGYREPLHLANGSMEEYLIELDRTDPLVKNSFGSSEPFGVQRENGAMLPHNWVLVSETSKVLRFRPPSVERLANRERGYLAVARAHLQISYRDAWQRWQEQIASSLCASIDELFALVGVVDVIQSLGCAASALNYSRPRILEQKGMCGLWASKARHPLMEAAGASYRDDRLDRLEHEKPVSYNTMNESAFVPNDISLGVTESPQELKGIVPGSLVDKSCNTLILSGPNMGGKSTYCRMCCLIVIMAQLGSFVPAQLCVVRCCDNVLTNIGLYDDTSAGVSAYMTEMRQLSSVVRSATSRTLVAIDELGRRTSAQEGGAVGEAILHYLHNNIGCRTICTSHLTKITRWGSENSPDVKTATMSVLSSETSFPVFLFKLEYGVTTKSYGIEVAQSAGVARSIVSRAYEFLTYFSLEQS
eukprot:gb/GECG01013269.1/.p1 GENE.gb/GECG01013269.1/~~gb/GECG01013269.1/.p1  ORF type:complete len:1196 (+),score=110.71 gb/GECG01013269.1/:1-3588(+)